jgi:hypothetical protein
LMGPVVNSFHLLMVGRIGKLNLKRIRSIYNKINYQ